MASATNILDAAPPYRVVLIEDNPGDAEMAAERLADTPVGAFAVRTVPNLAVAVEVLRAHDADAIVLDLNLPDSVGVATLAQVKAAAGDTPIVVVSSSADEALARDALALGAEEVFAKNEVNTRLFSRSILYVIERKRAREQQRRLESLLETTPDAILVLSGPGTVLYVNGAALSLFGRSREELLGELLGFSARDGEPTEIVIPRRGMDRVCEMRVVRFQWQGEPAFLGAIRDLTELKTMQREATEKARLAQERAASLRRVLEEISALARRLGLADVAKAPTSLLEGGSDGPPAPEAIAEALVPFEEAFRGYVESNAKLAEQNRELAEAKAATDLANQELDAFSYSVAHDLKGPLRAIDGFGLALAEDAGEALSGVAREHLSRIRAGAQRMNRLIDDIFHLSRVTRRDLRKRMVNISKLAHVAQRELQLAYPERSVEFTIEEDLVVEGDEHLLQLVLTNLLGNAWKFTGKVERPSIEFGRAIEHGEHAYFVRDNGAGFDPEYSGKLFTVFQRLHSASQFDGTGVGLSIVKRVIQRHGGRVWADGAVGKGATFYFTLSAPASLSP